MAKILTGERSLDGRVHGQRHRTHLKGEEAVVERPEHITDMARGGKLTAAARNKIPTKSFALPGRRYPIEDASHARNALARVSQHGSSAEKARVRAAVHRKYPGIGKS